jgi:hypothetical protein
MKSLDVVEALRQSLPAVFREVDAEKLSGGVLRPGTLANQRSRGEIPSECWGFDLAGCVVLHRDAFLDRFYAPRLARRQTGRGPFQRKPRRSTDSKAGNR